MSITVPALISVGQIVTAAYLNSHRANWIEIDPTSQSAEAGQVLLVNSAEDGYDFGSPQPFGPPAPVRQSAVNWYTPGWFILTLGTETAQNEFLYYIPISVSRPTTFDRIGCEVTTSGGTLARLGICEIGADGQPGPMVLDAGTVATNSNGAKEITISQLLEPGNYFLMIVTNAAVVMRGFATGSPPSTSMGNTAFSTVPNSVIGFAQSVPVTAFADPPPPIGAVATATRMFVQLRETGA